MIIRTSCISSEDKLELLESLLFQGEPEQAILFPFGHDRYSEKPPPTNPTTRKDIREFVFEINQEIACIDKQLRAVRAIQNLLEQRQSAFVKSAKYHRFQLAPICLLPDEILLHIFQEMAVLEAPKKSRASAALDVKKSPWVITHVCRHWRSIVVSAGSMWTNINVNMTGFYPRDGATELLRLHLERSQSSPLDVKLSYDMTRWSRNRPWKPLALFQTLLDHGDHIRFFDVYIGGDEPKIFHDFHAVQFPQLLTLRLHAIASWVIPGWLLEGFITASQLYQLDIHLIQFRQTLALPQITTLYSHITILSLLCYEDYEAHSDLVLRALTAMPNLEQCTLRLHDIGEYLHDESQQVITPLPISIVMKALSVLHVYSHVDVDTDKLFSPLTLPSLEILQLHAASHPRPISWLIERSECCISNLMIEVIEANIEDLISMLGLMPVLNRLKIRIKSPSTYEDTSLFEALIAEEGSPILCPKLERLLFEMDYNFTESQVLALIRLERSRSVAAINGVTCLRSLMITIWFDDDPRTTAVDMMYEFMQTKGLDELRNVCEAEPRTDLEFIVGGNWEGVSYAYYSKSWTEVEDSLKLYDADSTE